VHHRRSSSGSSGCATGQRCDVAKPPSRDTHLAL
jgi:hypothetical protein